QIKKLSDAELYIRIGHIAFEQAQMDKLKDINSDMLVVDSSKSIKLRTIETHNTHKENKNNHEDEGGNDPHIWLDPNMVKIQAENIYQALIKINPENKNYFLANKNKFIKDLDSLDKKLKNSFKPIKNKTILVFHPAFGYLADAYNFHQEAIEIEGKDPTIKNLQKIIDQAKKDNIKVIFVQKQFSTKSAQVIADAIGGTVVQIDPLAQNYFANLEDMAYTINNNLK
ncbi:zinc ABC transporter substrate-binding protein, partial [bacterium]|nr:zinc ABC transporter substrate-binding protein [bacterium]